MECQQVSLICDQHILFIQQIHVEYLLCVVPGSVLHPQGTSAFKKKGRCLWWWEVDRMQWTSALYPSSFLKGLTYSLGSPDGSVDKEPTCSAGNTGDASSLLGSGTSPGGGHGSPLQYTCLENPMDRRAWRATDHGISKSQTRLKWAPTHKILKVLITRKVIFVTLCGDGC